MRFVFAPGPFLPRHRLRHGVAIRDACTPVQQSVRRYHRVPHGRGWHVSIHADAALTDCCFSLWLICRFSKRDFDELMHYHGHSTSARSSSLHLSSFGSLKCCLILPCNAADEEIFRVGKHLHTLLKIQGSLYYRTLDDSSGHGAGGHNERRNSLSDLLNDDGKMTEETFRRFAKYRVKREEVGAVAMFGMGRALTFPLLPQPAATESNGEAAKPPAEHFLAYPRQRSAEYCLQVLKTSGWDQRLSS